MAVSTVLYDRTAARESSKILGVPVAHAEPNSPPEALLKGYKAALWLCFAFAITGLSFGILVAPQALTTFSLSFTAMVLSGVLLRNIGYVGHSKKSKTTDEEK